VTWVDLVVVVDGDFFGGAYTIILINQLSTRLHMIYFNLTRLDSLVGYDSSLIYLVRSRDPSSNLGRGSAFNELSSSDFAMGEILIQVGMEERRRHQRACASLSS
jgi:hypothetical protein